MPVEIILPKVDMDMATGRISRWTVAEGGQVKKGDVLFEIETDKAAMEIDAPVSGTVRGIVAGEGTDIPVGTCVAWIYEEGEAGEPAVETNRPSSPVKAAKQSQIDIGAAVAAQPASGAANGHAVRATPLARRIGRELGVDLAEVTGTGPQGRIRRADIEAHALSRTVAQTLPAVTQPAPLPAGAGDEAILKLFAEGSYDIVPHDTMRLTIARRLTEAKSTIPHFYLKMDCAIDELLSMRSRLNDGAPRDSDRPRFRLSVNDIIIKALALSLRDVPEANVSWTDGGMIRHHHVDVGVAVSIPGGLITPIIREAEGKMLSQISNEMKDLAERARTRKLKPAEYQGGTTAISNLGMFGVESFSAIVNPPHASILAVGAGEKRAVIRGDQVVAATMMSVTLSTDHRAVDGALAAQLIAAFRRYVEDPWQMLV